MPTPTTGMVPDTNFLAASIVSTPTAANMTPSPATNTPATFDTYEPTKSMVYNSDELEDVSSPGTGDAVGFSNGHTIILVGLEKPGLSLHSYHIYKVDISRFKCGFAQLRALIKSENINT